MTRGPETELVMERPQTLVAAERIAGAGIKTILFHVQDDDLLMGRLQLALSIARACGAHIHCLHVTPIEAYTVVDTFGGTFVNREIVDAIEQQAARVRVGVEQVLASEDVTWDYEEITGELVPHLVQSAALADLVITGREPGKREFGGPAVTLIGDLLAQVRTPLLVAGDRLANFDPLGPAVIAWNGSYEAANAIRTALPLLKMASNVAVVTFTQGDEKKNRRFPSTTLLEYLSRQGIAAELETRPAPPRVDEALVGYAERRGAETIVIGGYSHSRAGEFLFGGVTRSLLKECPIALVMAH